MYYHSNNSTSKQNIEGVVEQNYNVTGIFIDHQKAFDCIDRKILVAKLKGLGVEGVDLE